MDSNSEMVDYLKSRKYIESNRVKEAFLEVDRRDFVPEGMENRAYEDHALRQAENSTLSAPHMVAIITELSEVEADSKVLEIGSGSGYQLGILSVLAKSVKGIEPIEELARKSRDRLSDRENVEVVQGTAPSEIEEKYDRILISCGVDNQLWDELKQYLNPDGIMVGPVSENGLQKLRKFRDGEEEIHGRVRFTEAR